MGNLAYTTPGLEPVDEDTAGKPVSANGSAPSRLKLFSKPLLVAQPVPEPSIFRSLAENLRDTLFPRKLPPLVLTSRPIAVGDPMAVKRSPKSSAAAFIVHVAIIALIAWLALAARRQMVITPKPKVVPIEIRPFIPMTVATPKPMGGGGGGGTHSVVEPTKGHLPRMEPKPIVQPQILRIDHPKLAVQPAVMMPKQVNIPDNKMPDIGVPQSTQVAVASQGAGSNSGFGQGSGGGIGAGGGNGVGIGSGGGYGGGVMSVGGGVSAPQLVHSVDPEFTDAARRANLQGIVSIQLIVDSRGNPQNIRVVRHLGMGLDQKAIEAVRQYKFSPAVYQGHPVAVQMVINVSFHLY
ncbi:MAG: energy transducer TonB [Acidobacteriaceae bacterium]